MKAASLLLLVLLLAGCADPAKVISAGSYRNSVSEGTEVELAQRDIVLSDRPECRTQGAEELTIGDSLAVHCTASIVDGSAVTVDGVVTGAGTPQQHEDYVVRVNGRTLLHAPCLGAGCR